MVHGVLTLAPVLVHAFDVAISGLVLLCTAEVLKLYLVNVISCVTRKG